MAKRMYKKKRLEKLNAIEKLVYKVLAEKAQLEAENAKLTEALRDFGRHSAGCKGPYGYTCKCGWEDFQENEDLNGTREKRNQTV